MLRKKRHRQTWATRCGQKPPICRRRSSCGEQQSEAGPSFPHCLQTGFHLPALSSFLPPEDPQPLQLIKALWSHLIPKPLGLRPQPPPLLSGASWNQSGQGFTQPHQPQSQRHSFGVCGRSTRIKVPVCASWDNSDLRPLRLREGYFSPKLPADCLFHTWGFRLQRWPGHSEGDDTDPLWGAGGGDCWEE